MCLSFDTAPFLFIQCLFIQCNAFRVPPVISLDDSFCRKITFCFNSSLTATLPALPRVRAEYFHSPAAAFGPAYR